MKSGRSHPAASRAIRHTLTGVALALLAGSCAPSYNAPPVTARLAAVSQEPVSRLERGYFIHQAKCAKCHPFEDPAKHDATELAEEILPVMARKANLESADREAVLAYLLAARKLTPPR
jgi:hypothetical protein